MVATFDGGSNKAAGVLLDAGWHFGLPRGSGYDGSLLSHESLPEIFNLSSSTAFSLKVEEPQSDLRIIWPLTS